MKILAAGRDTPSCGDLHQRFFTNNLLPLPVVGNDLDRHLSCTFIVDPGFMRRTNFFYFLLRIPTVVSERSMSRCRYDLEHMGCVGITQRFVWGSRLDLLLDNSCCFP